MFHGFGTESNQREGKAMKINQIQFEMLTSKLDALNARINTLHDRLDALDKGQDRLLQSQAATDAAVAEHDTWAKEGRASNASVFAQFDRMEAMLNALHGEQLVKQSRKNGKRAKK